MNSYGAMMNSVNIRNFLTGSIAVIGGSTLMLALLYVAGGIVGPTFLLHTGNPHPDWLNNLPVDFRLFAGTGAVFTIILVGKTLVGLATHITKLGEKIAAKLRP